MIIDKCILGAVGLSIQLVSAAPPRTTTPKGPTCSQVVIPVTIEAQNLDIPPTVDFSSGLSITLVLAGIVAGLFGTVPIKATYYIAGTYCEPEVKVAKRSNTLQFLSHPATYDRNYWFGGNHPGIDGTRYSWVSYASKQGYPTFSIDRLGNGISSHPNGLTEVQVPAQAATVAALIAIARAGGNPFPRKFSTIILVGASMGSLVNNEVMGTYPNAANASILTAFTKMWVNVIPGFTVTARLLPAAGVNPSRFGTYDATYLAATTPQGVQYLLFQGPSGVNYDPAFIQADYDARGTITVGEAVSGALPPSAPNFKGSVLVITGQQDVVFCGHLGLQTDPPSDCLSPSNQLAATASLYPSASNYTWFSVSNSGHCWEHQYNAQLGFQYSHQWLAARGY